MAHVYAPFGLRPAYHTSGVIRPSPLAMIESGYNTSIFQGYPILINASGNMVVAAAGNDSLWNGVFSGVEFNDLATGRRLYNNRWVADTVLPTNHDLRAYYTADDVGMVYEIQANATLTRAAINEQFNIETLAGHAITGLATFGLNVASGSAAAQRQLRVIGLNPGPDNEWGDAFPIVLVQNAAHPWVGRLNAF